MTALYVASQNGHVEVVNILLQNRAHVNVQKEVSLTFLHTTDRAVKLKAIYVSQKNMTLTSLSDLMFIFGQDKWTPLIVASHNGHVDVVNVLLQHGASVCLQNKVKL